MYLEVKNNCKLLIHWII